MSRKTGTGEGDGIGGGWILEGVRSEFFLSTRESSGGGGGKDRTPALWGRGRNNLSVPSIGKEYNKEKAFPNGRSNNGIQVKATVCPCSKRLYLSS